MTRKLKGGVLGAFCKYTEDTEIPAAFAIWSGIAAISATLGRDCFVDQGFFVIYPNLYIVLVAGSARCRKSTAIGIAEEFIKSVSPSINTLSQKMTPEGLIGALGGLIGEEGATQVIPAAVGIAIVDELSTLIDKNAFQSGMIALLTDLYDAKDFEYLTRGRGKEIVKNPCLSLLGGSTLHWIKESIPIVSIGGGFTSRIVFIYKDSREKNIAWPVLSEENKALREHVRHDLNEIAKMRGPFGLKPDALDMYKLEYENFYMHSNLMDDVLLGGYAGRRHHILLKVAMITSAARSDDRLIAVEDMTFAIGAMRKAEESMPLILKAITAKEVGNIFEQIICYLGRHQISSHSDLVRQFRHQMTSQELSIMMKSLEDEKLVAIELDRGNVRYIFKGTLK